MGRIGILTAGGDCPGLNAVIRGVQRTAAGLDLETIGFLRGYEGLIDPVTYVNLDRRSTTGILTRGGTILGSTNRGRFAATKGVDERMCIDPQILDCCRRTFEQLGLIGLICVGGEGSLSIAQQLFEAELPVVGVPKTIDNDLSCTAFTFGFDSAISCATDAIDRLHTTAESHNRILVLEVMGRHAGWIALHAGIAGGADVILIPEITWSFDNVCAKILQRDAHGAHYTLIVVAEGAHLPDGTLVGETNNPGDRQRRLGGVGEVVAREIEWRTHRETRVCVLGHLQRGGAPTAFDRMLATQFGSHAVRLIAQQRFGEMVCYTPPMIESVPIAMAVASLARVNPVGSAVSAAKALGISFGDCPTLTSPFRKALDMSTADHSLNEDELIEMAEEILATH